MIWDAYEVQLSGDELTALEELRQEMEMVGKSELENRFTHHAPDSARAVQHARIRQECHRLAAIVDEECPTGREQSLALTKIEEAMFWANAALARNP